MDLYCVFVCDLLDFDICMETTQGLRSLLFWHAVLILCVYDL